MTKKLKNEWCVHTWLSHEDKEDNFGYNIVSGKDHLWKTQEDKVVEEYADGDTVYLDFEIREYEDGTIEIL